MFTQAGVTRYYNWTVARQNYAPDGVQQYGELINGQFPGPTIEANWYVLVKQKRNEG